MNLLKTYEELFDILGDYFAFECEEHSWESGVDLEDMSYEDMLAYYIRYIGA
tara:strand:- start:424 stop:579 length:156 start_codon:yes stop_codon:yes gene_type:complete